MTESAVKWLSAAAGGTASFLWGGWDALLTTLAVFVVIDYVTGFLAAGKEGRLNSDVGLWGIAKKVLIFAVVTIAHHLDQHLPSILPFMEGQSVLRDGTVLFYLANETLSILENAGRLGVPIPPGIQRAVEELKAKGELSDENQSAFGSEKPDEKPSRPSDET